MYLLGMIIISMRHAAAGLRWQGTGSPQERQCRQQILRPSSGRQLQHSLALRMPHSSTNTMHTCTSLALSECPAACQGMPAAPLSTLNTQHPWSPVTGMIPLPACSGMGLPQPGTGAQSASGGGGGGPSGQMSTAEQARMAAAILAQMAGTPSSSSARSEAEQKAAADTLRRMARAPGPSLGQLLNTETLQGLLAPPEMLQALSAHLPETQRTPEGLSGVAGSAALRHQVGRGRPRS